MSTTKPAFKVEEDFTPHGHIVLNEADYIRDGQQVIENAIAWARESERRSRDQYYNRYIRDEKSWWYREWKTARREAAENSEVIKTRYRWSRFRWALGMLMFGIAVGRLWEGLEQGTIVPESSDVRTWDDGFRDGMAYTIKKHVDGKLLKTPEESTDNYTFFDCIFVKVVKESPLISMNGTNSIVANSILGGDPLQVKEIPPFADSAFEDLMNRSVARKDQSDTTLTFEGKPENMAWMHNLLTLPRGKFPHSPVHGDMFRDGESVFFFDGTTWLQFPISPDGKTEEETK